jgi:hypothetical protein
MDSVTKRATALRIKLVVDTVGKTIQQIIAQLIEVPLSVRIAINTIK